jgi:hemerythrin-like domain-containing protein
MLRDKNLIPLSRQHQHALAMCVRLKRALQAGEVDSEAWQAEIAQLFELEVGFHFAAEEKEVFPSAAQFPELRALVEELKAEHEVLRKLFWGAQGRGLNRCELGALQAKLAAHIRKEERQLFEAMQKRMGANEISALGTALEQALAGATTACAVTSPGTGLSPNRRK